MPAWAALLPLLVAMPETSAIDEPLIQRVGCTTAVNGNCIDKVAAGGAGGAGGNASATYNIIIGGAPQGGAGGNGGNASGSPNPAIKNVNAPAPAPMKPIKAVISRCLLEIAGKPVVDNSGCGFEKSDKKVSFYGSDAKGLPYVTTVVTNADMTTGQGYLAGGRTASSRSLGTMTMQGPCWRSMDGSVRVCGWK